MVGRRHLARVDCRGSSRQGLVPPRHHRSAPGALRGDVRPSRRLPGLHEPLPGAPPPPPPDCLIA
eukprot:7376037-Prymnesium_polylepis.1